MSLKKIFTLKKLAIVTLSLVGLAFLLPACLTAPPGMVALSVEFQINRLQPSTNLLISSFFNADESCCTLDHSMLRSCGVGRW